MIPKFDFFFAAIRALSKKATFSLSRCLMELDEDALTTLSELVSINFHCLGLLVSICPPSSRELISNGEKGPTARYAQLPRSASGCYIELHKHVKFKAIAAFLGSFIARRSNGLILVVRWSLIAPRKVTGRPSSQCLGSEWYLSKKELTSVCFENGNKI